MTGRVLVVGYGSIGARHARLLGEFGHEVVCVTRNADCPFPRFQSIEAAFAAGEPQAAIVANATAEHLASLGALASEGFRGRVLVEKPLAGEGGAAVDASGMAVFVAYNLRFHPLVLELRRRLEGARLLGAAFQVGQYLPDWRPGTDYRQSYSASRAGGGGVLRDLAHEIDLATWLCGCWRRMTALVGRFSDLEIDTDDTAMLLAESERCPAVSVAMNYLDRSPRRTLSINAERSGTVFSAHLDFIQGRLAVDGETVEASPERDATYRAQLSAFLGGDDDVLCSLAEAMHVDRCLSAAEAASTGRIWVDLRG